MLEKFYIFRKKGVNFLILFINKIRYIFRKKIYCFLILSLLKPLKYL